ncbi:MAG: hypothetical protein HY328_11210 [Chloroflexi bacterium]|nr:hypothetical protein [Chloroflexota bacterium]
MAKQTEADNEAIAYALATRSVTAQPAKRSQRLVTPRPDEAQVALVADFHRRFPGEHLTLFVRVQPRIDLASCALEVRVPEGLRFDNSSRLCGDGPNGPNTRIIDGDIFLTFDFVAGVLSGETYEYALRTVVEATATEQTLNVTAVLLAGAADKGAVIRDEESLAIAVSAKSSYVRYLPSLYTRDELMGRFLMLFESFLAPISQQIRQVPYYFDPSVTPADMLPWLASWLDLTLDPEWPEPQRRALLKAARRLYQKRGTARGLQEYLEIYTGGQVQIIEHRADNFVVGKRAELGNSIALGRENHPHTFTVVVRLPADLLGDGPPAPNPLPLPLRGRAGVGVWRQRISAIIDKEKPVHTTYALQIETIL